MEIKKRLYKHDFGTCGIVRPLRLIPTFDFAQSLYPRTQTIHHIVPDTHVVDHSIILPERGQGRSNIMERMCEILENLRAEGWNVTINPCNEITLPNV